MVQPAYIRVRKHEVKVAAPQVRARFAALKDMMVEQEYEKFGQLVAVEETIKPILQEAGIPTIEFPIYYSYGRLIWGKTQKFTGASLSIEVQIAYEKFRARGLNATVLQSIASALGVTIPSP